MVAAPWSGNLSANSEWLPTMENNKNILYLKDVIIGHRCKGNSDHELSWMVGRVSYSFHDGLLTKAPWIHDFHDPRLSPAVLKARNSNAILRVPGPPPCAAARPAPAAAAGTRLTGLCSDTAGGKGQGGWSLSMSSQCSSTHWGKPLLAEEIIRVKINITGQREVP